MYDAASQISLVFSILLRDGVGITKHKLLLRDFARIVPVWLHYRVRAARSAIRRHHSFHPNAAAVTPEKDVRAWLAGTTRLILAGSLIPVGRRLDTFPRSVHGNRGESQSGNAD